MSFCAVTILACSVICGASNDLDVLQPKEGKCPPAKMMETYLNGLATAAFARRAAERETLATPEDVIAYQERMKRFMTDQLGGFPERTPLNARVVGKGARDGWRFEKLIYESRPGMFVTAVLFLPAGDPPYPAVLIPCGHSNNGKASELYQRACIELATNGIAALIYDPIDQGERYQLLDNAGKPRYGGTMGHTMTGVGCILLGTNTATYRIWDGMRGIDYLVSRSDIDSKRIGCAGNSGGGTLTSYLMALDERILCAAPSCYLTSLARLLDSDGPQDSEQDIFGQIANGLDHADYLMMRAPRPTLVCCATQDFFDIRGTWESFREAKRVYGKLDVPEQVDIVEAPEKHGYTTLLRHSMVRWMKRWMTGSGEVSFDKEPIVFSEAEIQCSPEGQVMRMDGARSVYDQNAEQEKVLAKVRKEVWRTTPKDSLRQKVREIAGVRPLDKIAQPGVEEVGVIDRNGCRIRKLVLRLEPGIDLPALHFTPTESHKDAYLYLNGKGKTADLAPVEALVRRGRTVLAVDLRGMGETQTLIDDKNWTERFGGGWKDFYRAYMLGKSYVGMRTEDVLACARFLADSASVQVHMIAVGEAVPPAQHAAALEPQLFASARFENGLTSWADLVRTPEAKNQLLSTVHGALRVYDLPDLRDLMDGVSIDIVRPLRPQKTAS